MKRIAGVVIGALVLATSTTSFSSAAAGQVQAAVELAGTVSTATSEEDVMAALAAKADVLSPSELLPALTALPAEAITSSSGTPLDLSTRMAGVWRPERRSSRSSSTTAV